MSAKKFRSTQRSYIIIPGLHQPAHSEQADLSRNYTQPKKKLSQNRTSRWAYSLRKKKKSTPTSNETEISNEINDFQTVHEL